LREHREDILPLGQHFIHKYNQKNDRQVSDHITVQRPHALLTSLARVTLVLIHRLLCRVHLVRCLNRSTRCTNLGNRNLAG
jgi:hypothetical protein